MSTTRFCCDYAKRVAKCQKCKMQLEKGILRMGKIVPNFFLSQKDDGKPPPDMKQYFHVNCLFEMLFKARATTKVIESTDDVEGFEDLKEEDVPEITKLIDELVEKRSKDDGGAAKTPKAAKKKKADDDEEGASSSTPKAKQPKTPTTTDKSKKRKKADSESEDDANAKKKGSAKKSKKAEEEEDVKPEKKEKKPVNEESQFNRFYKFAKVCEVIGSVSKHSEKSSTVTTLISKKDFDGDLVTWFRLLLPGTDQRVYNIKEKQIIKHFAQILKTDQDDLTSEFKSSGDVSETIRAAVEKVCKNEKSDWSLHKVDRFLTKLTELSSDDEQKAHFKFAAKRLSPLELQYLIRLVMKDLRIGAGTSHILEGLHPKANETFQSCRDLEVIIQQYEDGSLDKSPKKGTKGSSGLRLGTPVLPMLAEACKSVEFAMKRCKNGMYAEIKYDGERIQIHKKGRDFTYYSRSLKPVQDHKISTLRDTVTRAFPRGDNLIIDAEILLVDTTTGKPLPFGTLGVHKKEKHSNASICLYVFDILLYNDDDLTSKPLDERKKMLMMHMTEVQNKVLYSNYTLVKHGDNDLLKSLISKAIDEGLEGLVIKDVKSPYEPGKRHWLKVKKDYLEEGKMADTADLIVLGAYIGTGAYGGMMSVFLMGVRDEDKKMYLTVTKCGNGHTDDALNKINSALKDKMKRIDGAFEKVPKWMNCSRTLVPDYVIEDPETAPVWEITGAEFSRSTVHTADGMSIRFPRVTRIRDDKDIDTATSLKELKKLFETSKEKSKVVEDGVPLYSKSTEEMITEDDSNVKETKKSSKSKPEKKQEKKPKRKSKKDESDDDDDEESDGDNSGSENELSDVDSDDEEDDDVEMSDTESDDVSSSSSSGEESDGSMKENTRKVPKGTRSRPAKKNNKDNGEDDGEEERDEDEKCPPGKEPCWYGSKCYRKNKEHKEEFWHPSK